MLPLLNAIMAFTCVKGSAPSCLSNKVKRGSNLNIGIPRSSKFKYCIFGIPTNFKEFQGLRESHFEFPKIQEISMNFWNNW